MGSVGTICAAVIAFVVLIGVVSFGGYEAYAFYAPRYMAVDNQVFHQSQQYNDGMANQLSDYMVQYNEATSQTSKDTIRAAVRQQYASYPEQNLNADLRNFLEQMKGN